MRKREEAMARALEDALLRSFPAPFLTCALCYEGLLPNLREEEEKRGGGREAAVKGKGRNKEGDLSERRGRDQNRRSEVCA